MARHLSLDRTYSLSNYNNLKVFDSIELPDGYEFDQKLVEKIRYLQMIQLELTYRKYIILMEDVLKYDTYTAMTHLEELRLNTLDEIKNILIEDKKGE